MTKCCGMPAYANPMYYDETNCRFGHYATCAKCHKLVGREADIGYTAPSGIKSAWNVYSEVATREFHKNGDGRPLRFVMSKSGLVPLGFVPEVGS